MIKNVSAMGLTHHLIGEKELKAVLALFPGILGKGDL